MKPTMIFIFLFSGIWQIGFGQGTAKGIRGDSAAIADAEAMVETMGGMEIWAQLKSLHFVHEWYPWYRIDSYIENEILDLTAPRSRVERKSEIYHKIRAYSPKGKYWTIDEGEFQYADEEPSKTQWKELLLISTGW